MSGTLYFTPESRFFIAAEDVVEALRALQALSPSSQSGYDEVNDVVEAVNNAAGKEPRQALESIFGESAWKVEFDTAGAVTGVYLHRWGVEDHVIDTLATDVIFYTIAPYVRSGSYVRLISGWGTDVTYHFDNGKCDYKAAVDPLDANIVVMYRSLAERIHAYLIASDITGSGTGIELATEMERLLTRK
jgi:hypothetical protein